MKKILCAVLLTVLLLPLLPSALAESAETVTFKKLTVAADAEAIDLGKVKVGADEYKAFFKFLDKLPNLKKVDMFATEITRRRIEQLAERYPDVEFGWTMIVGNHRVRTDATAFSTRHSDQASRHGNEDFSVLKYCKNLQALDIGHNKVTDLSFLYDLPHLKVLIVVDNRFRDITPIASLKELEYLELFFNDVRDVTPLRDMTSLIDLNICYNRIQDLSPLEGLTGLERLWISHSNSHNVTIPMDEEQVNRLVEALPDTQVDSTARTAVEGGWRDHPHYQVVLRMFAEDGQYEPFPDEDATAE